MVTPALHIHAGPKALAHIRAHGLWPEHVGVVPAAAGGPKGLILGPLLGVFLAEFFVASKSVGQSMRAGLGATLGLAAFSLDRHSCLHLSRVVLLHLRLHRDVTLPVACLLLFCRLDLSARRLLSLHLSLIVA